jgi:methylated-DNA-[protein]-cysteine S-methyltransferase
MKLEYDEIPSPIGTVTFVACRGKVCALDLGRRRETSAARLADRFGAVELRRERDPRGYSDRLRAYFAGELPAIDGIPVDTGGTPFQLSVWSALREIPVGQTRSYAEIARAVGRPTATRAVGAANGQNPVALIVPCHRVIGADGSLTGYGGGLRRKRWLLDHEGALAPAEKNRRFAWAR